ncbi:MAG: response regulator [Ardenticatenaceae bacterium]|nr:response regulator [Ardenticatenaceae bacterium]
MSKKILVVDDEPDLVHLYQLVLEMNGYQVRTANGGLQALELYHEDKPHLILLDVMMPDLNGLEVCKQIRDSEGQASLTKIIMYTANDSVENRKASQAAGADELVSKDVPFENITAMITSYLATRPLMEA